MRKPKMPEAPPERQESKVADTSAMGRDAGALPTGGGTILTGPGGVRREDTQLSGSSLLGQ